MGPTDLGFLKRRLLADIPLCLIYLAFQERIPCFEDFLAFDCECKLAIRPQVNGC